MGYELNRLMNQYGLSTPTMAGAPQMPGSPPVESAYTGATGSPGDATKYAEDKAAFDESVRKYGLAQKEYNQYANQFQNRLANTNMYNQAQFSTTGANVPAINTFSPMQKHAMGYGTAPTAASTPADYLKSDAYKDFQKGQEGAIGTMDMYQSPYFGEFGSGSMGRAQDAAYEEWLRANPTQVVPASQSGFGIGQEAANKNIRDWMAANPNPTAGEFADIKQKYGINDYDIRNAMGTGTQYGTPQWTDKVKAPTYGVAPISLVGDLQGAADWYAQQRGIGYTDADLRSGAEKTFGKLPETGWTDLLNRVYPQYVDPINAAYGQLGRSGYGTDLNQIDNPGYNYWMNQLSTGAVSPENLNQAIYNAAVNWNPAQGDAYDLSKVPQDFDWTYYVNQNPDLLKAGIDTRPEAQMHYAAYGMNEGRLPYEGWTPTLTSNTDVDQVINSKLPENNNSLINDLIEYVNPFTGAINYGTNVDNRASGVSNNFDYDAFAKANLPDWVRPDVYAKALEGFKSGVDFNDYKITGRGTKGTLAINYGDFSIPTGFRRSSDIQKHAEALRDMYNAYTNRGASGDRDNRASGGYIEKYAEGGAVKGYQAGGLEDRGMVDPETGAIVYPVPEPEIIRSRPIYEDPVLEGAARAIDRADAAAAPAPAPAPAAAPMDARTAALQAMLERYGPQDVDYGSQIESARTRQAAEQKAFEDMLRAQLDSPEDAASSKAEMYFRLAAAFGSPTKTGHFTENLSMAGKEMAETAKSQRESRAKKLGVRMELQKMRMDAAGKELDTLRALQSEGMRDRRAIAQELIRDYIQSGKPQSTAGKTALDMGLQPGTPEYQAKVQELTELQIQREMAAINAQIASTAATTARAGQMSSTEINLRTETENNLANINQALQDVQEAYRLNPNSYAGGWLERGQRWLYEVAGSDDPKIVNTRRIDNLLGAQALGSLRAIFGGNPTEGERNILLELQGIGSKSLEERRQIMLRLYEVLQDRQARESTRLQSILSGAYRSYEPIEGGQ